MEAEVLIIGAGVMGSSLAYHLSKRGKRVLVIEKECAAGTHASGKNAGMVRQLYRHPQLSDWTMRSIASWPKEIKDKCFQETGSVIVGRTMPNHHQHLFEEITVAVQTSSGAQTQPAIHTPSDGLLDSPGYINELISATDKQNCKFLYKRTVTDLFQEDQKWIATTDSGERIVADWVVNAAGVWLNRFLVTGQSAMVDARAYSRHLYLVDGYQ